MSKRSYRSREDWKLLVEEYGSRHSGESKNHYCRKRGISSTTFYKWCKEFKPEGNFIKVRVKPRTGYLKIFGINLIKFELSV